MEKRNVPKLRFKGFEDEWKKNFIGNLCSIKTGNKDTQNKVENGKYPFFVRSQNVERINSYSFDGEAILTAGDGVGVGKVFHYVDCKFDYHQRVYNLHNFNCVNGRFLYEFFRKNFMKQVRKYNAKTSVDSVRLEMITQMSINIPSLEEQTKIANFLSNVDKIIEEQEGKVKDLELYKKGMMQKIFKQEIRFKDDNGQDYPEWEETLLGDISDVRDGTHESPKYVEEGYPLITSKNLMKNGSIDYSNVNYITESDYININKRSEVEIGDILFGMIGTIGNSVLVDKKGFAIKNVALIKEKNELKNIYLLVYLNSSLIAEQFYKVNTGGTQKFIALNLIRNLKIQLPCLEEQEKIANFLSNIDKIIEEENKKLEDLRQWKKGLLQQMFV